MKEERKDEPKYGFTPAPKVKNMKIDFRKHAAITINAVAWNGEGKVLKWQAVGEFNGLKVYGYPCTNKALAERSLRAQCERYLTVVPRILDAMGGIGEIMTMKVDYTKDE